MENTLFLPRNVSESCTSALCISQVTFVSLIAVVSLSGNLAVLLTLLSTASLRNSHGYLLTSLAAADLGVGLIASLAVYPCVTHVWPYGDVVCRITAFVEAVFTLASSLTLILLSIERYIAVAHPFKYGRLVTKRNTVLCSATISWLLPVIFYSGFVLGRSHYVFNKSTLVCTPAYGNRLLFTLVALLLFFLPCVLIIGFTSVTVHRKLSQNVQQRESMLATVQSTSSAAPSAGPAASSPPSSIGGASSPPPTPPQLSNREVKMFRLVRVVAVAFYVCWVPQVAVGVGYLAAGQIVPNNLQFFFYWLHLSSGLCNFVIYFVMNTTFRGAIAQKMTCCLTCCKKRGQSYNVEN